MRAPVVEPNPWRVERLVDWAEHWHLCNRTLCKKSECMDYYRPYAHVTMYIQCECFYFYFIISFFLHVWNMQNVFTCMWRIALSTTWAFSKVIVQPPNPPPVILLPNTPSTSMATDTRSSSSLQLTSYKSLTKRKHS